MAILYFTWYRTLPSGENPRREKLASKVV